MFEANGYRFKFYRTYNSEGQKVDTVCEVSKPREFFFGLIFDPHFITKSVARLNPTDRFSKQLGKVIALDRALNDLGLNHNQKKEVFAKFEEVFPQ